MFHVPEKIEFESSYIFIVIFEKSKRWIHKCHSSPCRMLPVTFYGEKEHFFKTCLSLLKSKTGKNELFGFYFFTLFPFE